MRVRPISELILVADSQSGARPTAAYGTTVTPGNNTYGSWAQLLTATSEDADWIEININSISASATATDTLVTIGVDPAGGTSYTDLIPHLLATAASPYFGSNAVGGIWYRFPLRIRAGSTLAARASQNNASPSTGSVLVRLYRQSRPDVGPRVGTYVKTFGEVTASSKGTDITSGTTAEGAWTQLGSAVGADDHFFFWQIGIGQNAAAMSTGIQHVDLGIGDGTNYRTPILDETVSYNGSEMMSAVYDGAYATVADGDKIYARAQGSGAATTLSAIAYAVGG
jgi:hypothetical protein